MENVKPSYNTERLLLGERLPLDAPLSVILDVSERCNFRCNYCFRSGKKDSSWSYAASGKLMPMDVFERAAVQIEHLPGKIKSVSLSGHGEPMCNCDVAEMAAYLKQTGKIDRVEMHTNASLLTENNADRIARAGFSRIVVSLQGLSAADYERVCGAKINWEAFYSSLETLYKNKSDELKIHIKISSAVFEKEDYASEQKFYSMFGTVADYVYIENPVPLWKNISIDTPNGTNKFGDDFGEINYCPLVFYKMLVSPEGDIYPCTSLPPPLCIGNVFDTTLQDAWNSRARREFLVEHLHLTRNRQSSCTGCYVPVNSVMTQEDVIDSYKDAILERMAVLSDA